MGYTTMYGVWASRIRSDFNTTRDKGELWIANHIHMEFHHSAVCVFFHATNVVTAYSDGHLELKTKEYRTKSTKDAMNLLLPSWVQISIRDREWWVTVGNAGCFPFVEGFTVVEETQIPTQTTYRMLVDAFNRVDRNRAMEKKIARYINGLTTQRVYELLHPDKKNSPFTGDCFVCSHVVPEKDGDFHVRLHVEELNHQASLLLNAYIATGKWGNSLARLYIAADSGAIEEVKQVTRAFLREKLLEKEVTG